MNFILANISPLKYDWIGLHTDFSGHLYNYEVIY